MWFLKTDLRSPCLRRYSNKEAIFPALLVHLFLWNYYAVWSVVKKNLEKIKMKMLRSTKTFSSSYRPKEIISFMVKTLQSTIAPDDCKRGGNVSQRPQHNGIRPVCHLRRKDRTEWCTGTLRMRLSVFPLDAQPTLHSSSQTAARLLLGPHCDLGRTSWDPSTCWAQFPH